MQVLLSSALPTPLGCLKETEQSRTSWLATKQSEPVSQNHTIGIFTLLQLVRSRLGTPCNFTVLPV